MPDIQQSRVHRIQVGDAVEFLNLRTDPPVGVSGIVTAFANPELTYLTVKLDNSDEVFTVTEDELHRTGSVGDS